MGLHPICSMSKLCHFRHRVIKLPLHTILPFVGYQVVLKNQILVEPLSRKGFPSVALSHDKIKRSTSA